MNILKIDAKITSGELQGHPGASLMGHLWEFGFLGTREQLNDPTFAAMAYVFEASGTPSVHREQLLHELLPHTP